MPGRQGERAALTSLLAAAAVTCVIVVPHSPRGRMIAAGTLERLGSFNLGLPAITSAFGIVDIALIGARHGAWLRSPDAGAAVLYYRIITFKILVTLVWIGYRYARERQARGQAGERQHREQVPVVEVGDRDREHEQDDRSDPGQHAAGPTGTREPDQA